ncbi:MAG: iron chelate uptake ABC transporter family permease subunit, partial [Clostridiaceae bacterium]|nr:iron chelate uptake ABC transporter family permease subunit [Clostridiaceae bacterium]
GRYEIVWLAVPLVVLAFFFANHFNIVGMGRDFSKNLGVNYNLILFLGLTIAAMITAGIVRSGTEKPDGGDEKALLAVSCGGGCRCALYNGERAV